MGTVRRRGQHGRRQGGTHLCALKHILGQGPPPHWHWPDANRAHLSRRGWGRDTSMLPRAAARRGCAGQACRGQPANACLPLRNRITDAPTRAPASAFARVPTPFCTVSDHRDPQDWCRSCSPALLRRTTRELRFGAAMAAAGRRAGDQHYCSRMQERRHTDEFALAGRSGSVSVRERGSDGAGAARSVPMS